MVRIGAVTVAVLLGWAAGGLGCAPADPGGPNVVLVTVDTLRAEHLGCYGYALETSPTIDEHATLAEILAAAGSRTQAFVSVGHLSRENGFGQGFDGFDDDACSGALRAARTFPPFTRWRCGPRAGSTSGTPTPTSPGSTT